MTSDLFIDSGGFYSLLVSGDDRHEAAARILQRAGEKNRRLVTTDYVMDETATLLAARGAGWLAPRFFEIVSSSRALKVVWMDPERFERAKAIFLRSTQRGWSFTDCASFAVMKELRLREALATDRHFADAGFVPLLSSVDRG